MIYPIGFDSRDALPPETIVTLEHELTLEEWAVERFTVSEYGICVVDVRIGMYMANGSHVEATRGRFVDGEGRPIRLRGTKGMRITLNLKNVSKKPLRMMAVLFGQGKGSAKP